MYLWRAIDQNGEALDILVLARRDKRAALKLMRKLLTKHGFLSWVSSAWTEPFAAPPRSKTSDAPSKSAFFHWWIIVGWTPNRLDSSETVRSPLIASSATLP